MVSAPIIILAIGVFGVAGRMTRVERRGVIAQPLRRELLGAVEGDELDALTSAQFEGAGAGDEGAGVGSTRRSRACAGSTTAI